MLKKSFLILLLLFIFLFNYAQTQFGLPNEIVSFDKYLNDMHTADLNADGNIDVIASASNGKIFWYKNINEGVFSNQKIITSDYSPTSFDIADINNDTYLDIIAVSYENNKIAWFENDGQGNFSDEIIIINDQTTDFKYIYTADLNGDNFVDFISADHYEGQVFWCQNDGNGNFGPKQNINQDCINYMDALYAADIDDDGDMDVVTGSSFYFFLAWYQNDGEGNFSTKKILSDQVRIKSIYAKDLTNDGLLDIIVAGMIDDYNDVYRIFWFENLDNGNFSDTILVADDLDGVKDVKAADLNGDSYIDIFSASYGDDEIAYYKNTGSAYFFNKRIISSNTDGAFCVNVADIDNDSDNDLVSASVNDSKILWFQRYSGEIFFEKEVSVFADQPEDVLTFNMNNDTFPDVIAASSADNKISWYENDSTQFKDQKKLIFDAKNVFSIDVQYFNNDTIPDIVATEKINEQQYWKIKLFILGDNPNTILIDDQIDELSKVYAYDFNDDNNLDILAAFKGDNKIFWYENYGDENFSEKKFIAHIKGIGGIYSADIDNDSDLDVLASSSSENKIVWYENDSNGNFDMEHTISSGLVYRNIYAANINNDDYIDVVALYGSNDIVWYRNAGNGTFSSANIISQDAVYWKDIYAADLTNNGTDDIIFADTNNHNIYWLENDGTGNFSAEKELMSYFLEPTAVFADDINIDGDIDIIATSKTENRIVWFENLTLHIYQNPQDTSVCPLTEANFNIIAENVNHYQWQVDDGSGFSDLQNNYLYSGVNSNSLHISEATMDMSGYIYRCQLLNSGGVRMSDQVILTVEDILPPEPNQITLDTIVEQCLANPDPPTAFDICAGQITGVPDIGLPISEQGTYTITWTYEDNYNNVSTQQQIVIVDDTIAPVPDIAQLDDILRQCSVTITDLPTATDNCCGTIVATTTDLLTYTEQGIYTITWTYQDDYNNVSTQQQTVIIDDTTNPTIDCVDDQTINLNQSQTSYIVQGTEFDANANDNCNIDSIYNNFNYSQTLSGQELFPGTYIITWFANDIAQNTNNCVTVINVNEYNAVFENTNKDLFIYPNPSNGIFYVKTKHYYELIITDVYGKIIKQIIINKQLFAVDLSNYSSGLYFLKFNNKNEIINAKIIIE